MPWPRMIHESYLKTDTLVRDVNVNVGIQSDPVVRRRPVLSSLCCRLQSDSIEERDNRTRGQSVNSKEPLTSLKPSMVL